MQVSMKFVLSLVALCFGCLSCDRKQETQNVATTSSIITTDLSTWVKADLECEELRNADENDPQAVVYLSQLAVRQVIDTVYTCSVIAPQMYRTYDIPRDALSACGGWWAGRGNFYYALQEGDSIAIMHANPVRSDTLVFQYELLKQIPVSSSQE
jgi:hypothetical protein